MRKNYFFIFILLLFSSCSSEKQSLSASDTAKRFVLASLTDMTAIQYDMLHSSSQKILIDESSKYNYLKVKPYELIINKPSAKETWMGSIKTEEISNNGSEAQIKISSTYGKSPSETKLTLKKENGKWKILLPIKN